MTDLKEPRKPDARDIVTVNVGGIAIPFSVATISKYKDTFLAKHILTHGPNYNGQYFFEANPKYWPAIAQCYITGTLPNLPEDEMEDFYKELKLWGMTSLFPLFSSLQEDYSRKMAIYEPKIKLFLRHVLSIISNKDCTLYRGMKGMIINIQSWDWYYPEYHYLDDEGNLKKTLSDGKRGYREVDSKLVTKLRHLHPILHGVYFREYRKAGGKGSLGPDSPIEPELLEKTLRSESYLKSASELFKDPAITREVIKRLRAQGIKAWWDSIEVECFADGKDEDFPKAYMPFATQDDDTCYCLEFCSHCSNAQFAKSIPEHEPVMGSIQRLHILF